MNRLALYAPVWLRTTPSLVQIQGKVGAYRTVSRDAARDRWLTGVPEEQEGDAHSRGWFEMWADATFATDPKGEGKTLRAPNGVVQDGLDYWGATPPKQFYSPEKITAPVLLVLGEWDKDTPPYMAQDALSSPYQRGVEAPCGAERRHAYHRAREEPHAAAAHRAAVPGGAGSNASGNAIRAAGYRLRCAAAQKSGRGAARLGRKRC